MRQIINCNLKICENPQREQEFKDKIEKQSSYDKHHLLVNHGSSAYITTSIIIDDDHLYVGRYRHELKLSPKGMIYPKVECLYSITYKYHTNKVFGTANMEQKKFIIQLLSNHVPTFEYLKMYENEVCYIMDSRIFKAILSGKYTNFESLVKLHMNYHKVKNIGWKDYIIYLKKRRFSNATVDRLVNNVDNYHLYINKLIDSYTDFPNNTDVCEWISIFDDTIQQALVLGKRLNAAWSINRLRNEHTDMTRLIMKEEVALKDTTNIWNEDIADAVSKFGWKLVNNEVEAFETGMMFHNCVYTNYWGMISQHSYIVITKTDCDEPICVGFRIYENEQGGKDIIVDQMFSTHNRKLSDYSRECADEMTVYFADNTKLIHFLIEKQLTDDNLHINDDDIIIPF